MTAGSRSPHKPLTMLKREVKPYWNLSVKVLRAKFHQSYDYLSASDMYVILNLPTASARTKRTKTIPNSDTPEWNETFTFRVHSNIKNILEIMIYDEDPLMRDDNCATILFDVNNLTPGKKETKCFIINDRTKDELWIEFEITKSSETPRPCASNGVLVAGPFCELNVEIDKLLKKTEATQNMVLKLKGAYKEDFVISNSEESSSFMKTLRYFINRDLETELNLTSESAASSENAVVVDSTVPDPDAKLTSVPLKPLPAKHKLTVTLPLGENKVDLQLNTDDRSDEELDVRLDFDIPVEEKDFLLKRRKVVSQALQKALNLSSAPEPSKVPLVAVLCSGGGSRALVSTYGSLKGLEKSQLLDSVSYITGVSGATWALASIYDEPNWSKGDIDKTMESVKKELTKKTFSMFSTEQLRQYKEKMEEREKQGHLVSLIDMWGLALEYLFRGKKHMGTLSELQRTVSEGQNPLPIFASVNIKNGKTDSIVDAEWCEFTPYEVGFPKYGAFIPAQNFGSEYYLGHLVKKLPETSLSILVGMWSSIFSVNLTDIWSIATGVAPSWTPWVGGGVSNAATDSKPTALGTYLISPVTDFAKMVCGFMTSRPIVSQMYNFLRGFNLHRNYNENTGFIAWKDTHPDAYPNTMTPTDPVLSLVDAGFALNAGFPPVVRSHRHVDVILSLNYSWDPDQFKVVKQAQEYCTDRKIPFPKIDFKKLESQPLKEVYVFEDKENPDVPIVLHFPLANVSFRQFKAPGVKREGEKELKEGAVDVDFNSNTTPYATHKLTYTPDDFQRLINLTSYNIQNNKDVILTALNKALNRNIERRTEVYSKKDEKVRGKFCSAPTPKPGSQKTQKTEAR